MANEEKPFEELVELYAAAMQKKFGSEVAEAFKDSLDDLFEELEYLKEDLDFKVDDWVESALMDDLHSGKDEFKDEAFCKTFFGILKQIVQSGGGDADALLPGDMDWNVDPKAVKAAQEYMHLQCPGGGGNGGGVFAHADENRALYRTVAVGRKNEIELLSLIMEIYELSHIDNIVKKTRKFKDPSQWKADCKFFAKNKKPGDMLIRAILEFNKRIACGGPAELIMNPIQDDINVYIGYTLMMSKVVKKVIDSANAQKQNICPFQLDLVICGRRQKQQDGGDDNKEDDESDDDDDDDVNLAARLNVGLGGSFAPMVNEIPADGIAKMLQAGKMEFDAESASLDNEARTFRALNEMLAKKLGNASNKRIIVMIDRTIEDKEDTVYIYQTNNAQHDEIRKDFSDLHMSWKTKNALIPNYKKPDDEMNPYIGASTDFGDNAFVFSFHVHQEDYVKCDQWIKSQKSPFLPYHMHDVWPMYFTKKQVDPKYSVKSIYKNWALPADDAKTTKWIQAIDPKFHERLTECHLKYITK